MIPVLDASKKRWDCRMYVVNNEALMTQIARKAAIPSAEMENVQLFLLGKHSRHLEGLPPIPLLGRHRSPLYPKVMILVYFLGRTIIELPAAVIYSTSTNLILTLLVEAPHKSNG